MPMPGIELRLQMDIVHRTTEGTVNRNASPRRRGENRSRAYDRIILLQDCEHHEENKEAEGDLCCERQSNEYIPREGVGLGLVRTCADSRCLWFITNLAPKPHV
jgi:hypothetical protein